jgi:hypothetical protein
MLSMHYGLRLACLDAALVVFTVAAVKKVADFKRETLSMCVGKTVVTALQPFLFYGATFIK